MPDYDVNLPPRSPVQELVDNMLTNPDVVAELRGRNVLVPRRQVQSGGWWIAQKDGHCQKPLGWMLDDGGFLRERFCGEPFREGDQVWRQGYRFYGRGCHGKGIMILPRKFVQGLIDGKEFSQTLPDHRAVLLLAEKHWEAALEGGQLVGAFGTQERVDSIQKITDGIVTNLRLAQTGVIIPPKVRRGTTVKETVPAAQIDALMTKNTIRVPSALVTPPPPAKRAKKRAGKK